MSGWWKDCGSGITSQSGLIAHGRGEAFDYLIGERTLDFAETAIRASIATLLMAEHPVISVNGNTAALVPEELIALSAVVNTPLEINLFHHSEARVAAIEHHLRSFGARAILRPNKDAVIATLQSDRRFVNPDGIAKADVVFVPLEDGDRCGALRASGKSVITVDLNPLSRTARDASITIVDNVVRAVPLMIEAAKRVSIAGDAARLRADIVTYNHEETLRAAETALRGRF